MNKNQKKFRIAFAFTVFIFLFLALVFLNICLGSVKISLAEIFEIIFKEGGTETSRTLIAKLRAPRTAACVILGGALALSGFLLQTFFNNPIAGPYVLGISSGSKLAVALVMVFGMGSYRRIGAAATVSAAFVGAMISMGFVLIVAQSGQRTAALIVSGVMIGYICSALTDFIVAFADDSNIVNLHNWSRGTFSGTTGEDARAMAAVVASASLAAFFLSKPLGAYQLGENYAQSLGVNVKLFRAALVALSGVLCAAVTAFAGPVSFVGVASPRLVKIFLGTSRPIVVIPGCFLGGAIFCLACDLIARTVFAPAELSVSSVAAAFGAPVVIGVMLKKKERV